VEDHHLVLEGLQLILAGHDDLAVVAAVSDPTEAFDALSQASPDVMLVDLSLGSTDGVPLIRALLARDPKVRIIVVSMHQDAETVRQALLAGAAAYVVKGARSTELIEAIHAVARGERYLHSSVTSSIVEDSLHWLGVGEPLSIREREILGIIAAGRSASQVAESLGISVHTVRRHIANMAGKLQLHGTAALIRYAVRHGIARESDETT
jgi:two-component system nitrate/nitrite response regulator NarL